MRRIQIGVNQTGSDRFYSNYMVQDTKEKLLEYLQKEETKEKLIGVTSTCRTARMRIKTVG